MQITTTILEQIGTHTLALIGTRGMVLAGSTSVVLHVGGNVRRKVVVEYDAGSDTYLVSALRLRGVDLTTRLERDDVHAAELAGAVLDAAEAA